MSFEPVFLRLSSAHSLKQNCLGLSEKVGSRPQFLNVARRELLWDLLRVLMLRPAESESFTSVFLMHSVEYSNRWLWGL